MLAELKTIRMSTRTAMEVGPFTSIMRFVFKNIVMHICLSFGLVGNIMTIITLVQKRLRENSQTQYIIAITFFDSVYLICSFVNNLGFIYSNFDLSQVLPFLNIISYPLTDFAANASTYCILEFTIERYIVVSYPLHSKAWCRPSRSRKIIGAAVLFSFVCTLPTFFENKIVYEWNESVNRTIPALIDSELMSSYKLFWNRYFWFLAILFQFMPLTLLIILNSFLIGYINNDRIEGKRNSDGFRSDSNKLYRNSNLKKSNKNKATWFLVIMVLVFLICQLPSALLLIYGAIFPLESYQGFFSDDIVIGLNNIANGLVCINASINFILYSSFSNNFSRNFLPIFCGRNPQINRRKHLKKFKKSSKLTISI